MAAYDKTIVQLGLGALLLMPYVLLTENVAALGCARSRSRTHRRRSNGASRTQPWKPELSRRLEDALGPCFTAEMQRPAVESNGNDS